MFTVLMILSVANAQEDPADIIPSYEDILGSSVSFSTSKRRMYAIYKDNRRTLYCDCEYEDKVVDLESCNMGEFDTTRWNRTEAEHVVPASTIGAGKECWEDGGRDNCLKVDPIFKIAHNDLHNLYPAVGQVNGRRSNIAIGVVLGDVLEYPGCDFEINTPLKTVEPRPEVRGDIARTYFYMEWRYGVYIPMEQRRTLMHWHQVDPVDDWERERSAAIFDPQGRPDPFLR